MSLVKDVSQQFHNFLRSLWKVPTRISSTTLPVKYHTIWVEFGHLKEESLDGQVGDVLRIGCFERLDKEIDVLVAAHLNNESFGPLHRFLFLVGKVRVETGIKMY